MVVRAAEIEDLPALLALYRELHPEDPVVDTTRAEPVWAQMQAQPGRTVLVADDGRGVVGRRLLDAALEIALSAGCYKIQLLSAAGPPAPAFYEANGFRAIARGYRRYL